MTTYSKDTLKTFFENGDVPTGQDFANFIDSYVNVVDTSAQSIVSNLTVGKLITPRVSAASINITGTFSADNVTIGGVSLSAGNVTATGIGSFGGGLSAASLNSTGDIVCSGKIISSAMSVSTTLSANLLTCNTATFNNNISVSGNVSADTMNVANIVSAKSINVSAARITPGGVRFAVGIVSAAGTTQGAAAVLPNIVNRARGATDGSATGYLIPSGKQGIISYICNENAVSANLWPPSGGTINGLGANAAFGMAASTAYTIIPTQSSAYFVR